MDARAIAISHARTRIGFGAGMVLAPGLVGRTWIAGDEARRPAAKLLARALGVRDLAIGLGVVIALDRGAPVRGWLEAAALSDAVDLAATLLAGRAARRGVALVAAGSAVGCTMLARALDPPPPAHAGEAAEAALTGHPPAG
jgi:hypothetical protein